MENMKKEINMKSLGSIFRTFLFILEAYVDAVEQLHHSNNANEISQLVERAGSGGYRVELFREIIRYYDTNISQKKRIEEKNLLSRVLQLNIARSQIVEPDLVPGGVAEYVKSLFGYFGF